MLFLGKREAIKSVSVREGRVVCLCALACFETVVVLNELNTVIYLILKGNPRKAVCFLAWVLSCCAEVHFYFFARDKCFDVCL